MLSKKQRISKALARDVFARATHLSTPHFLVRIAKAPKSDAPEVGVTTASVESTESRFAVSVSKKVAHTAVLRNRTRRRVYSVIRDLLPQVAQGYLVAFSVKKGGETLAFKDISDEVRQTLRRARLI